MRYLKVIYILPSSFLALARITIVQGPHTSWFLFCLQINDISIVQLPLSLYSVHINNINMVNEHFFNLENLKYLGAAEAIIVAFFKLI